MKGHSFVYRLYLKYLPYLIIWLYSFNWHLRVHQLSFLQCLPFSWTTLRGTHCWRPIVVMGVVDTFGHCCVNLNQPCINEHFEGFVGKKLSFHGSTES